mmetsp:Transcript_41468/g.125582  ORF Transcript_41468/g.125582 Transcript_41468/m.125582 type:complete len:285 (+) Transcript_41468:2939-3793(+)
MRVLKFGLNAHLRIARDDLANPVRQQPQHLAQSFGPKPSPSLGSRMAPGVVHHREGFGGFLEDGRGGVGQRGGEHVVRLHAPRLALSAGVLQGRAEFPYLAQGGRCAHFDLRPASAFFLLLLADISANLSLLLFCLVIEVTLHLALVTFGTLPAGHTARTPDQPTLAITQRSQKGVLGVVTQGTSGVPYGPVSSTTAQVAIQVFLHISSVGVVAREEGVHGHDDAWGAKAALTPVHVHHSPLNRVQSILAIFPLPDRPHPLHTGDVTPVRRQGRKQARVYGAMV